jgi:hypothetical protein
MLVYAHVDARQRSEPGFAPCAALCLSVLSSGPDDETYASPGRSARACSIAAAVLEGAPSVTLLSTRTGSLDILLSAQRIISGAKR